MTTLSKSSEAKLYALKIGYSLLFILSFAIVYRYFIMLLDWTVPPFGEIVDFAGLSMSFIFGILAVVSLSALIKQTICRVFASRVAIMIIILTAITFINTFFVILFTR